MLFSISGLLDLMPLQWSFLGKEVGLKPEDLEGMSPQGHGHGHDASHIVVVVQSQETAEFHRQAHMFANSHGAQFKNAPGAHDMTVLDDLADPNCALISETGVLLCAPETNAPKIG